MDFFTKVGHHLSVRKRVSQGLEQYPHPDKYKRFLDKSIYAVGISGPLMTIPQLLSVWVEKSVDGLSLLSWSWYFITAIVWLIYAIVHKEKPLIVTNILWIIIHFFIVLGIIIYN